MASTIMNPRRTILLAHSIVEFAVSVEHLRALRSVGVYVPTRTLQGIERDLTNLMWFWCWHTGENWPPDDTDSILQSVKDYLRVHIEELDALLSE